MLLAVAQLPAGRMNLLGKNAVTQVRVDVDLSQATL
jgi:hypothetical protein